MRRKCKSRPSCNFRGAEKVSKKVGLKKSLKRSFNERLAEKVDKNVEKKKKGVAFLSIALMEVADEIKVTESKPPLINE